MDVRKYRWSKDYESAEEELVALLAAKKVGATRWTAVAGDLLGPTTEDTNTRVWCAEGSLTYSINGKRISMQPGDVLELPSGTMHTAVAGLTGCTCYQTKL